MEPIFLINMEPIFLIRSLAVPDDRQCLMKHSDDLILCSL